MVQYSHMGNTQVGKLFKKTIVRDMNGGIRDMRDEANGGWIVRGGQVVNQEKWNEYAKVQKDKQEALKAASEPKIREDYPEQNPAVASQLEQRVDKMEETLAAILKAVSKDA